MIDDEGVRTELADTGPPAAPRLEPVLGLGAIVAIGLGATFGSFILKWSIFAGPLITGAATEVLLLYVLGGVVFICIALAFADLAGRYPSAGGAFTYCHRSLGRFVGNLVGWCLVLEFTVFASSAARAWAENTFPTWPETPASLLAAAAAFCFFLLLLLRMRAVAAIIGALVSVQVIAVLVFIGTSAAGVGDASLYDQGVGESALASGIPPVVLIFLAMTGFEVVAMSGEDARSPRRSLPWAIVSCVLVVLSLHLAITVVALWSAASWGGVAAAPSHTQLISALGGDELGTALTTISFHVGLPAMLLALAYAQVRLYLAMSRQRFLPAWLTRVSASGAPVRLTLLCGAVTALLAGFGPPGKLLDLAEAILPLVFAMVALSMVVTRWRAGAEEPEPETDPRFETRVPWLVAAIAILGCGYVFLHRAPDVYLAVAGWLFAAVLASLIAYFRGEPPSGLDPAETIVETAAEGWLDRL